MSTCLPSAGLDLIYWSRIQAFFLIHVTTLVTEFIAPPLAAVLLNTWGPHFAFLAAVPLEIAAFFALGLIKEPRLEHNYERVSASDDRADGDDDDNAMESKSNFRQPWVRIMDYLRQDIGGLLSQKDLLLGLIAVVGCRLGRPMIELILQYMSVKFGWHFSKVRLLNAEHRELLRPRQRQKHNNGVCRPVIFSPSKQQRRYSFFWWSCQPLVRGLYGKWNTPQQQT